MKLYSRLQNRLDAAFNSPDKFGSLLEDTELITREKIELETESKHANSCYEELLGLQLEMEELFATFQSNQISTPAHRLSPPTPSITDKPIVRLTALDPPSWNGIKADFYTWKRKFIHIMEEAKIVDELTQLCYLQNPKILPTEYQVFNLRRSKHKYSTIQYEILAQFRKVKPLPSKRTPLMLREFANEISLFCRRMTDLGFNKENYSCIIMQDVYERLDRNTALRFRSKIELIKELGQDVVEDLDSLSSFIRSEATTLELYQKDRRRWKIMFQGN